MWYPSLFLTLLMALSSTQDMVTLAPSEPEIPVTDVPDTEKPKITPTIRSMHITSNIKYRYATTLVSTRVVNPANHSGEATFTVTLPESAFISEFLMEVKDKVYKAYVKEKEEAKAVYDQAVQAGQFAGHVALDARDSNQFTVSVNIEAHGKVTFNLTYEQLLARTLGVYSNVININPRQIVEDLSVLVDIEEPTAIVDLEVPELQMSNEAVPDKKNKYARIEEISDKHKQVVWAPTPDQQKDLNNTDGLSGQFIVKYDVSREENPQQILVDEGYFVHFFAPENLPKLRKHVVFVLDFSGSMGGRKLDQLKDAMKQILSELSPTDFFSIVIFESDVRVWSPNKTLKTDYEFIPQEAENNEKGLANGALDSTFVVEASAENIEKAQSFMNAFNDLGATNIIGGLRTGLKLVNIGTEQWINESDPPQPVIVFLTDGQPNVEEYDTDVITRKTTELNIKKCPIFSLAFGYGADFNFLRKLSLSNNGFARNIYEAADASQQLKNFYKTVASPLLSHVTFSYLPGQVDNSSKTNVEFPVFFSGSELVVAGKINKDVKNEGEPIGELKGMTAKGPQAYPIIINRRIEGPKNTSTGHLEKSWAYLTIQQLLDKADSLESSEEKNQTRKKALDLALQYSFVTPLTSLVVVKPNETESAVDATKVRPGDYGFAVPQAAFGALPASAFGGGFSGGGMAGFAYPAAPIAMSSPQQAVLMSYGPHMTRGPPPPPPPPPGFQPIISLNSQNSPSLDQDVYHESGTEAVDGAMGNDSFSYPEQPKKVSLDDIKWLQKSLKNSSVSENITVTVDGTTYKIGINETDVSFGDCQTGVGGSGECHHIQYCALEAFQNDTSQYLSYRCSIPGDFLGVCCPKELVTCCLQ